MACAPRRARNLEAQSAGRSLVLALLGVSLLHGNGPNPPVWPHGQLQGAQIWQLATLSFAARTTKTLTVFSGSFHPVQLIRKRALDRVLQSSLPMAKRGLPFFGQN